MKTDEQNDKWQDDTTQEEKEEHSLFDDVQPAHPQADVVQEPEPQQTYEEQEAPEPQKKQKKAKQKPRKKQKSASPMQQLLAAASEEDAPTSGRNVMQGLFFGDVIWRRLLKKNVWLVLLVVVITTFYIAVRYQCQRDLLVIDKKQNELQDAKYKAMTSSSNLTERTRESHILNALRQNRDSTLRISEQPPYIVEMPR